MKLLRAGAVGEERPCLLDGTGLMRDVSSLLTDLGRDFCEGFFENDGIRRLAARLEAADVERLPIVSAGTRIGPPTRRPPNIICVGLNYREHVEETKAVGNPDPVVFSKATSSWSGPNDPVRLPPGARKADWEVELACVIGRRASHVPRDRALGFVAGYMTFNDVSERELQLERGGQWMKGKSYETFAPAGPWMVTADEVRDPQDLPLWMKVNGEIRQHSHTSRMIFPLDFLIHHISRFMTLLPGDIVSTGTPAGVGLGMDPPRFLKPGDVMESQVGNLGVARQEVIQY